MTHSKKRILQPDPGQNCIYVFIKLKQEFRETFVNLFATLSLPLMVFFYLSILVYQRQRKKGEGVGIDQLKWFHELLMGKLKNTDYSAVVPVFYFMGQ